MRTLAGLLTAVLTLTSAPVAPTPSPSAASPGPATWSVAPAGIKGPDGRAALTYKLEPGASLTDRVAVTNHSRQPLTLRLYASDAFNTSSGGFDLLAGDRAPEDVGAWVKPAQTTVIVPGGSRLLVPLTISVPANATPGDHTGGVVASVTTAGGAGGVAVDHRVGTRVYLRVTGPLRPGLAIGDVTLTGHTPWNPLSLPEVTATFTVSNPGNLRLTGRPSLRAEGPFGLGGRDAEGAMLPQVLPGNAVTTTVVNRGVLPLGRVTVETAVHPQTVDGETVDPSPQTVVARASMWLIPWPQLVVIALVALLITGLILRRRRNRRRLREAVAAAERRGREEARTPTITEETA